MSLVRTCLRIAAVEALRDRTWAGNRVYDSNNAPIDAAARESPQPFLTVFTDTDDRTVQGHDIFAADQKLQLIVEYGIAGAVPAGDSVAVSIPATDAAWERALDAIERQILCATVHDPKSTWGEICKGFINKVTAMRSDRGAEVERGSRWAARALTLTVDCLADPPVGQPLDPDSPILAFLDACKAAPDTGLRAVAHFIEKELDGSPLASWRVAQSQLGITEAAVRGIGLAPPYGTPDSEVDLAAMALHPQGPLRDQAAVEAEVNPQDLKEPAHPHVEPEDPPPNPV